MTKICLPLGRYSPDPTEGNYKAPGVKEYTTQIGFIYTSVFTE